MSNGSGRAARVLGQLAGYGMLAALALVIAPSCGGGGDGVCNVDGNTRMQDLSVAQRQLVELAKALALEPRILVLDEPTAPLGAEMVERIFGQVREAAAHGAAVIYISHRLPEVREIADRVTVLRDGQVRASAPLEQLMVVPVQRA